MGWIEMPQRGSLLPYRGVLSFLSKAREASGSETPRVHHAARWRGGGVASGETARLRALASEMLALTPDVIVIGGRAGTVVPLVLSRGE
jgi:hypothetical protein